MAPAFSVHTWLMMKATGTAEIFNKDNDSGTYFDAYVYSNVIEITIEDSCGSGASSASLVVDKWVYLVWSVADVGGNSR